MTKQEFIKELRMMADNLEKDSYHFIDLDGGYIFGNRNYGELDIKVAKGVSIKVYLYRKGDDEKGGETE